MPPRIYKAAAPSVPLFSRSIFTHLFYSSTADSHLIGGHPGSAPAFIDAVTGTTLTRSQLKHLSLCFAYGLLHHPTVPLKAGDTVLIFSPNSLAWPVALFGSVAASLKATLANSGYTSHELKHQYIDSGARLVITNEDGLGVVWEMFKELGVGKEEAARRVVVLGSDLEWAGGPRTVGQSQSLGLLKMEDLLQKGKLVEEGRFDGDRADETVYLCYSSGTTGKPKGVEVSRSLISRARYRKLKYTKQTTHMNMTSVIDIIKPIFPPIKPGEDKMLGILPFYHVYGKFIF